MQKENESKQNKYDDIKDCDNILVEILKKENIHLYKHLLDSVKTVEDLSTEMMILFQTINRMLYFAMEEHILLFLNHRILGPTLQFSSILFYSNDDIDSQFIKYFRTYKNLYGSPSPDDLNMLYMKILFFISVVLEEGAEAQVERRRQYLNRFYPNMYKFLSDELEY